MFLARCRPSSELQRLQSEMNQLFDGMFPFDKQGNLSKFWGTKEAAWPKLDVSESPQEVHVTAELPGMKQEDICVELDDGILKISGERKDEQVTDGKNKHVVERYYGQFERSISIPCEVDREKIEATYEDGVLSVTLPKVATSSQSKRIAVKPKG